jgi:hypothetical protein
VITEALPPGQERGTAAATASFPDRRKAMDDNTLRPEDTGQLDDFQVIAERAQVVQAIAALTDRYRELNREMSRRGSLRWMLR